ncbi:pilus assembly protein PilM [Pontiella agarivorans]|uniref:Pilus assembly protein PilM n=1 Tax=Pontiella agarivorans TaxID=3038953 RepID=A0ABU5MYY9_9BACT|nr:pilus assembly protein PilM [Pontiella agarivorans]MDZ8119388.1 pilus assembly protein PilM [Pontiella agarivorans]
MLKKIFSKDREASRFSDLIGVDFSTTATKVVRLKKGQEGLTLIGMDLLPAVKIAGLESSRLPLPRNLTTNYSCLSYTGDRAVVRMFSAHINEDQDRPDDQKIRAQLNVADDFRVSVQLIKRGRGRQDSTFLAAAIPEADAEQMLGIFSSGPPAPASLEIAGLSFINAFLHAKGKECEEATVCLLETGETISYFAFLTNGAITLVGKLPFGAKQLREQVAEDLGLEEELAASILDDASINISSSVAAAIGPQMKQLSISKDFIERHQGSRISRVYLSGGLSLLGSWGAEVGRLLHAKVEVWNPLENIQFDPNLIDSTVVQQSTRFAAAIGAAIGGIE